MDVWEGMEEIDTLEYRSVLWYAIDTCFIIYMQMRMVQIRWRRHQQPEAVADQPEAALSVDAFINTCADLHVLRGNNICSCFSQKFLF